MSKNKNRDEFIDSLKKVDFTPSQANYNYYKNYLEKKLLGIVDLVSTKYHDPKNIESLDYIVAGLFIALEYVLPKDVGFIIEYRGKSFRSTQKTSGAELLENNVGKITKDIYGLKVIITDIGSSLDFDESMPNFDQLEELQNNRINNIYFLESTRKWLNSDSTFMLKTEDEYYKKIKEILKRLNASTYPQCSEENEISYTKNLEITNSIYEKKIKQDQLSFSISKEQINTMSELLQDLEDRLDDKLEREILKAYLPKALETNLVSTILGVNYSYEKEAVKPNGYVSDFYLLNLKDRSSSKDESSSKTEDILSYEDQDNSYILAELQAQSFYRYLCGKTGIAFHNGMLGKSISIDSLFELVDPNDSMTLESYLRILNQVPISTFEKGIIESEQSPLIQKVEEAYKHIKIKDTIKFDGLDYNIDEYLIHLAEYVASHMSVCRPSNDLTTPSVVIEHKGLAAGFSDVLRKKDGISCLAQLLVDRINLIVSQLDNNANLMPRFIKLTRRDIINYFKNLEQKEEKETQKEDTSR